MSVQLWTDGGCWYAHPVRPGSWAYVVYDVGRGAVVAEASGGVSGTTSNRMEMRAAIMGLRACADVLDEGRLVTVHSDSKFLVNGSRLVPRWVAEGALGEGGRIKNPDLWCEIDALTWGRPVTWRWVRGHSKLPLNEQADRLCSYRIDDVLEANGYRRRGKRLPARIRIRGRGP